MGEGLQQEEKSLQRQDTPIPDDDPIMSNEQHPFEQTREVRGWADESAEISIDEEEDSFTPNQQNPTEEKDQDQFMQYLQQTVSPASCMSQAVSNVKLDSKANQMEEESKSKNIFSAAQNEQTNFLTELLSPKKEAAKP